MWTAPKTLVTLVTALTLTGCSKEPDKAGAAASASASAQAAPSATPAPGAASASAAPSATAAEPPHDCPKGSTGEGSFNKPCEAKGKERMMELGWTGKTDEKGPQFRLTNKAAQTVLYGKIAVYFYDKAGKQLDVQDTAATPPKAVPYRTCSGNMFGGVMKPGEKAVLWFSCVKKEHVPEGTAAIEAEMQTVGFADASEKKVDYYWRNNDLVSDVRKKGGVK
jgi:hypothetical protein